MIFDAEYTPELKWILVEPHPVQITDKMDNKDRNLKYQSQDDIPDHHHDIINDFQSILYVIKLIEKMVKYNNIYYERIEKRRKQQYLELQGLTMFLQNICDDLKHV